MTTDKTEDARGASRLHAELGGVPPAVWWADYDCGCTSAGVRRKRDMPTKCQEHGGRMRSYHHGLPPNERNHGLPIGSPVD